MKRIDSLHIVQIRLFRNDEILLSNLRLENSIQKIISLFSFKQAQPLQPPLSADPQGAIAFISGEISDKEATFEIDRLIIESRRIVIGVASTSTVANRIFELLRNMIIELDKRESKPAYEPLVLTEESTTVVHLDFPITNIFSNEKFESLIKKFSAIPIDCGAKAIVIPSSIHFKVTYKDLPEALKKYNISLLDKDIAIELRINTDIGDNMYFISSPVSTDVHLKLISFIEDTFSK